MARKPQYEKVGIVSFCLIFFLFIGAERPSNNYYKANDKPVQEFSFLKDSDVICRLGTGLFSDLFRKYASADKMYSHIGLVSIEAGNPYIYHTEASELTGIGGVKKEKLSEFLEGIDEFAFYRPDFTNLEKKKILQEAKKLLRKEIPFDVNLDSEDDSEMYCTEFVAKSINLGMKEELISPSIKIGGRSVFGLDDIYGDPKMKLIGHAKHAQIVIDTLE